MVRTHVLIGAIASIVGLAVILTANAAETPPASGTRTIERSFSAGAVELRNLDATLRVETHDGNTVKLTATGQAKAIDALRTELAGDALVIEAHAAPRTSGYSNVVHVEKNVVINRGGSSTVIIGGVPTTGEPAPGEPASEPIDLRLLLPRSASLSVRGFTGTAVVAAMSAPVELELFSGSAIFERLAAASLSIAGGAEIEVARAVDTLDLTIDGAGEILVRNASISTLTVETNGTAKVTIDGRVGRAEMSLNGIADVSITHVDAEPVIDANGIATVGIGNW